MEERVMTDSAVAARFYDALRSSGLSAAALAHGEAYIGQECLLTPDEIADLARRAGITAGTSVLDIGSGTGGPACYLAQQFGCHIVGVDISAVGHAQAVARARDAGVSHLVQFRLEDIHAVALPPASFDVILSLDVWYHIPRRAALLQRCATLLRAGGCLAFCDHVERQPMPAAQRQQFCVLWRFPSLETPRATLRLSRRPDCACGITPTPPPMRCVFTPVFWRSTANGVPSLRRYGGQDAIWRVSNACR
jgi:SAM-dependent methyltransferase